MQIMGYTGLHAGPVLSRAQDFLPEWRQRSCVAKHLVIVESPAKAKTIGKYLGKDFVVESSIGHIRDLPDSAADVPAAYKNEPWARLGVDVENDFKPLYVVPRGKK